MAVSGAMRRWPQRQSKVSGELTRANIPRLLRLVSESAKDDVSCLNAEGCLGRASGCGGQRHQQLTITCACLT